MRFIPLTSRRYSEWYKVDTGKRELGQIGLNAAGQWEAESNDGTPQGTFPTREEAAQILSERFDHDFSGVNLYPDMGEPYQS